VTTTAARYIAHHGLASARSRRERVPLLSMAGGCQCCGSGGRVQTAALTSHPASVGNGGSRKCSESSRPREGISTVRLSVRGAPAFEDTPSRMQTERPGARSALRHKGDEPVLSRSTHLLETRPGVGDLYRAVRQNGEGIETVGQRGAKVLRRGTQVLRTDSDEKAGWVSTTRSGPRCG
jgi:hypothetical protein